MTDLHGTTVGYKHGRLRGRLSEKQLVENLFEIFNRYSEEIFTSDSKMSLIDLEKKWIR